MMATVATMSGGHHPGFSMTSNMAVNQYAQPEPANDDQYCTTFFCRALYDYQTNDPSSLSFQKNDIIEVLTQLESGWWDGLLGDERGWFPSNYVSIITDDEAEAALSGSEISAHEPDISNESIVDMSHAMLRDHSVLDREWLEEEMYQSNSQNGLEEPADAFSKGSLTSSDFWMPQVNSSGQIYYVNTQTGQHSRDLPHEADGEASDSDLTGLVSQSSSRSGTSAGLRRNKSASRSREFIDEAGFGIPKRSTTPEHWVRRLADDGMSYYYWNKLNGQIEWTLPIHDRGKRGDGIESHLRQTELTTKSSNNSFDSEDKLPSSRLRADSSASESQQGSYHRSKRTSLYSDDSDIQPHLWEHGSVLPQQDHRASTRSLRLSKQMHVFQNVVGLTSTERLALSLQEALSPSPPELIGDLLVHVRSSISTIIEKIQAHRDQQSTEDDQQTDNLVQNVVMAVRNLLYVCATPSAHLPSHLVPPDGRETRTKYASQPFLKPAQRKVTATLSKLVLSARAMQYDAGIPVNDSPNRLEGDATELERAVIAFALEAERCHGQPVDDEMTAQSALKRLFGTFSTDNVGLGLVGAGSGGSWRGFGWVALSENEDAPGRILGTDVLNELSTFASDVNERIDVFTLTLSRLDNQLAFRTCCDSQEVIASLSSFLVVLSNIHVARHVDIDGIAKSSLATSHDLYQRTVGKARAHVRTLEVLVQSLYDDGNWLLFSTQYTRFMETDRFRLDPHIGASYEFLQDLAASLKKNLAAVQQQLEALLSIGHDQADMSLGDYNGSIEWRMSRMSIVDNPIAEPVKPFEKEVIEEEEMVDFDFAFRKPGFKLQDQDITEPFRDENVLRRHQPSQQSQSTLDTMETSSTSWPIQPESSTNTITTFASLDEAAMELEDDNGDLDNLDRSAPRAAGAAKLRKILGNEAPQHYLNSVSADQKPWYLRSTYSQEEIIIDPDGAVKGGTVPALVERLTSHELGDPNFIKTFLMTYKSFTTTNELFNLLVQRFWIQPAGKLSQSEFNEWVKLKQHVIQMRVLNTFKSMVVDDDVLERDDMYILDRMKEFISNEEVVRFAAAKQLLILIDRAQKGSDGMVKMMINTMQGSPPAPIAPKTSKKLKLLDVNPLELARQLTIMESQLYQKIRPMECLVRSRENKTDHSDNIAAVIQTSNRIADWVAESILSRDESRRRAEAVRQFISVADRCRALHNYSTMVAITSGLNTPPIRRLKRTWDQVNAKYMSQLSACETTIDSNKNFNNYRSTLASVTPPCVPFIGVFLTTLQFIQDGSKDDLPGNLVNFRKRQKASEVIQDIKRWQSQPYNLVPVPSVLSFIEESLNQFNDAVDIRDHFWNLSLEREPREREDEKMARLLQESGFL